MSLLFTSFPIIVKFWTPPPTEVENCSVAEETETSFRVFCNASSEDSDELDEHFYIEIREFRTGELLQNFSLNFPEAVVRGLDPGTWYAVTVYATNEAGRSKPYTLEIRTFSSPVTTNTPSSTWDLESSPLFFIIGAAVGGFLLVVVIICCALKFRLSRRKSKGKYLNATLN
ncbi:fibronectin type-III domain-containing protein [Trichonephila inaurata madagascariensis]|uniref:Fibronectin type-III domain-containing protein n=1 Tax=Trichonephila inaurata madagascariensis TaxID=2747483 RepID=A0A8X7CTR7_9ARAC|nr:fibronectin type-III domain-containing protein [Trichonephila inaurata madagascariensis]